METDYSKQVYDKYYTLRNRTIELVLKDGRQVKGIICGFFRGDAENNEPYITKWHVITEAEKNRLGTHLLGCINGEIIKQEAIIKIIFNEHKKEG